MHRYKARYLASGRGTSRRCLADVGFGAGCLCVLLFVWPVRSAELPLSDSPAHVTLAVNGPATEMVSNLDMSDNHPIENFATVAHCLDAQHDMDPLKPASYQAYERHVEVARLLPYKLFKSDKTPPQEVLTVVTTLTADRVDMLTAQCESWSGPLSAVMYVPLVTKADQVQSPRDLSPEQLSTLQAAAESLDQLLIRMSLAPDTCTLTVLLVYEFIKEDMADQLPINSMRNQALLLARTPLVTMLDVDLLISSRLGTALSEQEEADGLIEVVKGQKRFVVLPAFDPDIVCARDVKADSKFKQKVVAEQQRLADQAAQGGKRTVQGLVKLKLLEPFTHQVNPEGHADTKYHIWMRCNKPACISYRISPKSQRFEPWGIVDRELAMRHPYDELYRGYGKNKVINILHLQSQGFELRVLGWAYVVHRPHKPSDAKNTWIKEGKSSQGVHLNSIKFDQMLASMANKTYTPKVAPHTAACMEAQLEVEPAF